MGDSVLELIIMLVKSRGFRYEKDTEYCKKHHETHLDCLGCESKEGCDAVVKIGLIMITPMMYKPTSFEDFLKMQAHIDSEMRKILKVKEDEVLPGVL